MSIVKIFGKVLTKFNLFLLLYFLLLVYIASNYSVWNDELYSLHTTSADFKYALKQSIIFESQAPLYFLILKAWRLISDSVFFARILSILIVIATVYLSKKLSERYFPGLNSYIFAILIALNPHTVWAALEIRVYGMAILLSTLLLIFFYDAYLSEKENKNARIWYIVTAVISIISHYFLGFILAANGISLLIYRKYKPFKNYMLDMVLPLLITLAIFYFVPKQFSNHTTNVHEYGSISEVCKFIVSRLEIFLYYFDSFSLSALQRNLIRLVIVCILILLGLKFLNRDKYKTIFTENILLPGIIFISFCFMALHYLSGCMLMTTKHLSVLFMPFMVVAVFTLWSFYKKEAAKALLLTLICIYPLINYTVYKTDRMIGTNESVQFITKTEKKGQPLIIYRNEIMLEYEWYYYHANGINTSYPIPKPIDFSEDYNNSSWVINNRNEFEEILAKIPSETGQYWLVMDVDYKGTVSPVFHYDILNNLIHEKYKTLVDFSITDVRTRLIERKK